MLGLGYRLTPKDVRGLLMIARLMSRPEEELLAGRAWVDEVMDNLPNSTMKMLAVSCHCPVQLKLTI
jgi:hypothetical protein